MKYVLAIASMIALLGVATLPAEATFLCPTVTNHTTTSMPPPECALPDTKSKHPNWFRDGGYCTGGAATSEVTGSSQVTNCVTIV